MSHTKLCINCAKAKIVWKNSEQIGAYSIWTCNKKNGGKKYGNMITCRNQYEICKEFIEKTTKKQKK